MKNIIAFGLFCFLMVGALNAQPNAERRDDRIKSFRIAIFTDHLNLTSKEAEGFWPVYNDYLDKREALHEQLKPAKQLDSMSDAEVEEQIKRHFERQARELDLERDLYQKLRNVLPVRKIAKLPAAERQFRESLVKKVKEMRDNRAEGGGRMKPKNR